MTDKPEAAEESTNFLAVVPEHKPELVLLDEKARAVLFEHIEKEVGEKTFDMTTTAGRDECRSFAAKITKTKTALTATALALTEAWRKSTAEINKQRKPVEERLAALAVKARAPLTSWEEAEAERAALVEKTILALNSHAVVHLGESAEDVTVRLASVKATGLSPDKFKGAYEAAETAKARTIEILEAALARLKDQEAQAAELEKLRAEAETRRLADEAREKQEREAREAAEAAEAAAEQERIAAEREKEAAARAAERETQRRKDSAKVILSLIDGATGDHAPAALPGILRDMERITPSDEAYGEQFEEIATKRDAALADLRQRWNAEQERQKQEAADLAAANATREAEAAAAAAAAEAQRAADEALAAEKARAEAAEAAAESERRYRAEQDRLRAVAEAAEAARREKAERDADHRQRCKQEAKDAIMSCGADVETARKIVLAILAGEVPRITLDFAAEPRVVSAREAFEDARADAPEAAAEEKEATLC